LQELKSPKPKKPKKRKKKSSGFQQTSRLKDELFSRFRPPLRGLPTNSMIGVSGLVVQS